MTNKYLTKIAEKATDRRKKDAAVGAGIGAGLATGGVLLHDVGKHQGMKALAKANDYELKVKEGFADRYPDWSNNKEIRGGLKSARDHVNYNHELLHRFRQAKLPKKLAIAAGAGILGGAAIGALAHREGVEKKAGWDTVGRIIKRVGNTLGAKTGLRRGQMGPAAPKGFGDKVRGFGQDVLNDKGHARLAVGATGGALVAGVAAGRMSKKDESQ